MSALGDKTVVVGVCGGIAAYKAAELVRQLRAAGARVFVILTAAAQKFVTPLTFQTLSGHRVGTDLFDLTQESEIGHIHLAEEADLVIVAPATADTLARAAAGRANDLLTATLLVSRAPVLLAPSMNGNMWQHPLTQANVARLRELGRCHLIGPATGALACGWVGPGRLVEPEIIAAAAARLLTPQDLAGRKLLVSAGPTYEPVDAVRFLGNRSSGRMGLALAAAASRRGATVTLVAGPTAAPLPLEDGGALEVVRVETAAEMQREVLARAPSQEAAVMAAAVADFRPAAAATDKLHRSALGDSWHLELVGNPDILKQLGAARATAGRRSPLLVGFAAETGDLEARARAKLRDKQCDLVVANDVTAAGSGFGSTTNQVSLVAADGTVEHLPLLAKEQVAERIWDRVVAMLASAGR